MPRPTRCPSTSTARRRRCSCWKMRGGAGRERAVSENRRCGDKLAARGLRLRSDHKGAERWLVKLRWLLAQQDADVGIPCQGDRPD